MHYSHTIVGTCWTYGRGNVAYTWTTSGPATTELILGGGQVVVLGIAGKETRGNCKIELTSYLLFGESHRRLSVHAVAVKQTNVQRLE